MIVCVSFWRKEHVSLTPFLFVIRDISHYMGMRFSIGWLSNGEYTTPSIQRGKFTSAWNLSYCNWNLYSVTNLYELNYVHCLSLFLVPLELHAAKNKSEKCKISDFVFIFFDLIMLEYAYNQFPLSLAQFLIYVLQYNMDKCY